MNEGIIIRDATGESLIFMRLKKLINAFIYSQIRFGTFWQCYRKDLFFYKP